MSNNSHVTDTNVGEINYEIEVKKLHPDAYCDYGDIDDYTCSYWITTPKLDKEHLSLCIETTSEYLAWKSAYQNLKK